MTTKRRSIERRLLQLRAELAHDEVLLHRDTIVEDDEVDSEEDLASWMSTERLLVGLLGRTATLRAEVDAAIRRLSDGTFGTCEQCGGRIASARLEAIPYVSTCIGCARAGRPRDEDD